MSKLKVLDLFSGIGGFSLGLERTGGFETVAFCEIDPFCRKVLNKHWPDVEVYEDVRTIGQQFAGTVDVITGGYPCQPFSTAGRRRGEEDDRHLWPSMFGIIKQYRPAWVIGENVAGHISLGLDDVLSDLGGAGYSARAFVIPACAVNAVHRRDRVWVVGYANKNSWEQSHAVAVNIEAEQHNRIGIQDVANTTSKRQQGPGLLGKPGSSPPPEHWEAGLSFDVMARPTEPAICGADDGVSCGVDRLRALGNSVVPQIPEALGRAILQVEGMA